LKERIIENWLDKSTERSYQIPFCQALIKKGHSVIHLTRHSAMEMGKDVISISPEGIPCAYQLKSTKNKRLTLSEWRSEIEPQLNSLVYNSINENYVKSKTNHNSYVVINKFVDEEVVASLSQFNETILKNYNGKIKPVEIIHRGQLLDMFLSFENDLWPSELFDIKTYLELFLEDGKGMLNKYNLGELLKNTYFKEDNELSKTEVLRAISSASLITASAISNYTIENNHFAEFEAWVMYLSYTLAIAEKNNLNLSEISSELNIAKNSIYNSLSRLCDELSDRNEYLVGTGDDIPLYWIRITNLAGLMSLYGLWRKIEENEPNHQDEFIKKFLLKYERKLYLWGEYAVPQGLAYYLYSLSTDSTLRSDFILLEMISTIMSNYFKNHDVIFPNPYYNVEDIFDHILKIAKEPLDDSFDSTTFTLEGLMHLFNRKNWKQRLKVLWIQYSHYSIRKFVPKNIWEYYFWRCKDGIEKTDMVPLKEEWNSFKEKAFECEGTEIPSLIKNYPILYLCFIIVNPHRLNSSGMRWLDTEIKKRNFKY